MAKVICNIRCPAGYLPDFQSKCARKITIFECGAYYALTGRGGDVMILFLENRILWRVDKLAAAMPVQVYRFVSHKYGKRWKPHIFFLFTHVETNSCSLQQEVAEEECASNHFHSRDFCTGWPTDIPRIFRV